MQQFFRQIALFVLLITSIASPAQKRKPQPATSAGPAQTIKLTVDATHAPEKILHAQLEIPVTAGEVKLVYPKMDSRRARPHRPNHRPDRLDVFCQRKAAHLAARP